jgi:hypothetical protein
MDHGIQYFAIVYLPGRIQARKIAYSIESSRGVENAAFCNFEKLPKFVAAQTCSAIFDHYTPRNIPTTGMTMNEQR